MLEEKINEETENETSPIWEKLLEMLKKFEPNLKESESEIFCRYFAEMEDGSTCLELTSDEASKISAEKLPNLIYCVKENPEGKDNLSINKPFVIFENHLFATKYFIAKCGIEDRITKILKKRTTNIFSADKAEIAEYFKELTSITLNDEQTEAIRRGLEENLIITGGPGTGKTTVVCYLLWKLLQNTELLKYSLYLAAPSGKASDRLKEGITDELAKVNKNLLLEEGQKIFDKLSNAESYTIHRLLSYNPSKNAFSYNRKNQFMPASIFVIDEASMIDISLFASLLEAIPDDAIVFILGDKDQLPSVDAGMVLGELLESKDESVTKLTQSVRFKEDSEIGHLKNAVQEGLVPQVNFTDSESWTGEFYIPEKENGTCKEYPVSYLEVTGKTQKERAEQIGNLVIKWSEKFYDKLAQDGNCIFNSIEQLKSKDLDSIWKEANSARIMCAERQYLRGVEEINKKITSNIIKKNKIEMGGEEFFAGELLMLTKNQKMFDLYNGDTGIVFDFKDDKKEIKYLMLKKAPKKSASETKDSDITEWSAGNIFQIGAFIFYPLYLLPRESLEIAYAITIHKAQGSGYEAILIFLPEKTDNPLLNRQILYTALTRTKGSTYLVANQDILAHAIETKIKRITMIKFKGKE